MLSGEEACLRVGDYENDVWSELSRCGSWYNSTITMLRIYFAALVVDSGLICEADKLLWIGHWLDGSQSACMTLGRACRKLEIVDTATTIVVNRWHWSETPCGLDAETDETHLTEIRTT